MPYTIKQHEWPIPEGEQEAARFIIRFADESNHRQSAGGAPNGENVRSAFESFKNGWYGRLWRKLNIPISIGFGLDEAGFASGAFSIWPDGTELLGLRVEREP